MMFSQYIETCGVIIYHPKRGGDDIEDCSRKTIRNHLHASIDVHIRILIAEIPIDGIKCIEKLQSHCTNMTFAEKLDMTILFNMSLIKEVSM